MSVMGCPIEEALSSLPPGDRPAKGDWRFVGERSGRCGGGAFTEGDESGVAPEGEMGGRD